MAWTYSSWITETAASTRLTQLRLHIQEVSDKITASVSSQGMSRSVGELKDYLLSLREEEKSLAAAASGTNGGVSLARFRSAR